MAGGNTPGQARPPSSVLVCFAVPQEAGPFKRSLKALPGVAVLLTGIGQQNAAEAIGNSLALTMPMLVVTCGFAGGLNPKLPVAAVLFSADAEASLKDALASCGAFPATFHCSHRIAVTAAEKMVLRKRTGADAVEMESGAIRDVCRKHGIRSVTVRAISDAADQDLPLDFNELMTAGSKLSYGKLALSLMRKPQTIPGLLRLQRHSTRAARALGRVLTQLLRREGLLT